MQLDIATTKYTHAAAKTLRDISTLLLNVLPGISTYFELNGFDNKYDMLDKYSTPADENTSRSFESVKHKT